ncbi:hypothetical protein D7X33_20480, partial [Butyricicoccus sp. 1XD8-22]
MTSNNQNRDEITQKIIYFSEAFKDDPLFNFIENRGLREELFDYDSVFLKAIDINGKYNNDEVAPLVGASSGQRILNFLNDKKRNFKSYVVPAMVGQKYYLHDSIVVFKLRMIFFLLSKNYKPNEIGHILGMVDAVGVVSNNSDSTVQKNELTNIQQAEIKGMLFEHIRPIYAVLNSMIQNDEKNKEAFKHFQKVN